MWHCEAMCCMESFRLGNWAQGDVKSPELDDIYPTWDKKEGCNSCRKVTMTAAVVLEAALSGREGRGRAEAAQEGWGSGDAARWLCLATVIKHCTSACLEPPGSKAHTHKNIYMNNRPLNELITKKLEWDLSPCWLWAARSFAKGTASHSEAVSHCCA